MGKNTKSVNKAIILAGGKGTRLEEIGRVLPKPLMPVGDKPVMELLISRIKYAGIDDITVTVGHLAKLISNYFGDGKSLGVKLSYSKEEHPLGTAGPLSLIDGLNSPFLVSNGDIFCDMPLFDLMDYHVESGAIATISSYTRNVNINMGVMEMKDNGNQVVNYIEKPDYTFQISMGIYVFDPAVLDFIAKDQYLDFPDLVLKLIDNNEKVKSFPYQGIWRDLGRPEDYVEANKLFDEKRNAFYPSED